MNESTSPLVRKPPFGLTIIAYVIWAITWRLFFYSDYSIWIGILVAVFLRFLVGFLYSLYMEIRFVNFKSDLKLKVTNQEDSQENNQETEQENRKESPLDKVLNDDASYIPAFLLLFSFLIAFLYYIIRNYF